MRIYCRFPRYSLRTLLIGSVAAALVCAALYNFWWHPLQERAAVVAEMSAKKVRIDDLVLSDPGYPVRARPPKPPPEGSYVAKLLEQDRESRSIKSISFLQAPHHATDDDLRLIAALESVEHLDLTWIERTNYTGTGGGMAFRSRNIGAPKVTDEGIKHIANLPRLRWLQIAQAQVTDASCVLLSRSLTLEYLGLDGTQITDAGLLELAKIPTLKTVVARETSITKEGVEAFSLLRPGSRVNPDFR